MTSPSVAVLSNLIINSLYCPPAQYFEVGEYGQTGKLLPGRRPSESFIPVSVSKKGRRGGVQQVFDFDITGERRETNSLINDIRRAVERWPANNWNGVTPHTRKLLLHWAPRVCIAMTGALLPARSRRDRDIPGRRPERPRCSDRVWQSLVDLGRASTLPDDRDTFLPRPTRARAGAASYDLWEPDNARA
ncbi:hypothetical protein NCC78_00595 [Micromonospora phytophila]|uniref:hypothetical protein n=1 Tax=Micromonospora phytophila TaxID=709888 RepID=UPI00202EBDDF|nr:hypothetical protein [Micromonospora phytophila]MCM0673234.1 hypothetical protein [Micromonospora phytophila]